MGEFRVLEYDGLLGVFGGISGSYGLPIFDQEPLVPLIEYFKEKGILPEYKVVVRSLTNILYSP